MIVLKILAAPVMVALSLLAAMVTFLSSFANNTAKNSFGDILAIPTEQRDNNSGGSPYVP